MDSQPANRHRASASGLPAGQPALAGALLALAGAAWVVSDVRMAGMDAGPGTDPGALSFFLSTWVVMMAAMMLPALTPTVLAYRAVEHERRVQLAGANRAGANLTVANPAGANPAGTNPAGAVLLIAGYLLVWAAAGLLAYALLEMARGGAGGFFAWSRAGRVTAAGVLAGSAIYQLTPAKGACLSRCRNRRASLLRSWRAAPVGALRVGAEHGLWCLGCCWALMASLFALGAMSIGWMVLISVLVGAERLLPWRAAASTAVASLLAALAVGVAVGPTRVPLLTVPQAGGTMRAMGSSAAQRMPASSTMPAQPKAGSRPR